MRSFFARSYRLPTALATTTTVLLALASSPARADQFGVQLGAGIASHGIAKGDFGLVWDPGLTWWDTGNWHFALLGEFHLGQWHSSQGNFHSNITEFGLDPVVRIVRNSGEIRPYFEGGVGLRGLSHTAIGTQFSVSTGFQFTELVGVGMMFGARQQYQLGYRFQHISNAGIKEPNPGVSFHEIYVQYMF